MIKIRIKSTLMAGLIIILACILSNCAGRAAEKLPGDFSLVYGWGNTHAERGRFLLKIDSKGAVDLFIGSHKHRDKNGPKNWAAHKKYTFSKSELSKVYKEIKKNNFFNLKKSYINRKIMGGSSYYLFVRARGKTKTVTAINTDVKEISRIIETISQIIDSKDQNWRKKIHDY